MKTWDEMDPRSKDALVATEIMGWRLVEHTWPDGVQEAWYEGAPHDIAGRYYAVGVWRPTEFIGDAWEVVERMEESDFDFRCGWVTEGFWAEFRHYESPADSKPAGRAAIDPRDGNMATAISLAALRAKGVDL